MLQTPAACRLDDQPPERTQKLNTKRRDFSNDSSTASRDACFTKIHSKFLRCVGGTSSLVHMSFNIPCILFVKLDLARGACDSFSPYNRYLLSIPQCVVHNFKMDSDVLEQKISHILQDFADVVNHASPNGSAIICVFTIVVN